MKTAVLSVLFVLVLAAIPSRATLGVDVAYNYPLSSWKCLRNSGYEFAIVRCYQSLGHVDAQCAASVQKAWNAGFKHVDLYMFPCPKCGNATSQVKTLHDYVKAQGFTYGQLWVDIEGSQYWLKTTDANRAFYKELYSASEKLFGSKFAGTYTNNNGWSEIMGDWNGGAARSLWWPRYDNVPDLKTNWKNFGGWTKAVMKQYSGDKTVCTMDVDLNFY